MSENVTRVFDLLKHNLDNFPKEDFVCGKINGSWVKYSTQHFCELTDDLSRGLTTLGIAKGSRVGVMSANRPEWNICDFAIMQLGAYQIPLYPTLTEHDVKFIIENAEISIVFVSDEIIYNKLLAVNKLLAKPIQLYTFNKIEGANHWLEVVDVGKQHNTIDLELF